MPYQKFLDAYGEIHDLRMTASVLHWDQQTQMPPGGGEARGRQLSTLGGLIHDRMTSAEFLGLLADAEGADLDDDQRAAVETVRFAVDRATKLPGSMVREMTLVESRAFGAWIEARQARDFSIFQPHLERIIELTRQKADCFGWKDTPWNALVPDYERGIDARRIASLFAPLRSFTVDLLDKIRGADQISTRFLDRQWDLGAQGEFGRRLIGDLGFDYSRGRIDIAAHPFCTNFSVGDVRITSRFDHRNPFEYLFSALHETGHALYEQGFRPEDERTPLAECPSLGLHESQSRFWEVTIARSLPFWKHYGPIMAGYFPGNLAGVDAGTLYRAANRVEPGLIRVDADEVTYNLHIMIRFDLELALLERRLEVADLPDAWNAAYKDFLGVTVPHDGDGCLQDVHWSSGAFGYFPTYTLGNIYGAMMTRRMEKDMPDLWDKVGRGDFAAVLEWLRTRIHRVGMRSLAMPLVEEIAGEKLTVEPLMGQLGRKFTDIYNL
ncbi:MAG: carboxypeptidase M32 [Candidatus Sumerlaeia bacterium]|nr:carboxypeptidase M32 [Candidatus Sumerlaeia bacterium]